MTRDGLIKRLKAGKACNLKYNNNDFSGMVNIWSYNDEYILTWEECKNGNQWNESSSTKDERYKFKLVDEVMQFIDKHSLDIEGFKP
jgi:hypothetical protein